MADTNDQNQVGPPLVAAVIPDPVAPTATGSVTPEHLASVTALVDTIADLTTAVREVDDRTRILERDRREARGDSEEAPELTRIWVSAIEPLTQYLTQPVQLAAGVKPIQLVEAAEQLAAWVATYRENAVGPGGQGLQQDPSRLAAFETKLAALDPTPTWLEQEGQRLLIRPELDPETVRRTIAATTASLTEEHDRIKLIEEVVTSFNQEWEASIPALEDQLRERRDELKLLLDTSSTSPQLHSNASTGLAALAKITTDELVAARVRFGEWLTKYRPESTFTAEQVRERINNELRPLMRSFEGRVEQATTQWAAARLRTEVATAEANERASHQNELDDALARVQQRYASLVGVRRLKLGQNPDERFFGEVARLVNSAITDLGNLEAELLAAQDGQRDTAAMSALVTKSNHILRQSDDYADAEHLERRLTAQEKAKQREEERAASRERQLERERAKEEQRQHAEAERQAKIAEKKEKSSKHYQATQKLQAERQAFEQELRNYVTELTEANQERHRRADSITALIAAERQSLDDDRRQFADQRAERRSMSAAEATSWLAQLATQERQLESRQARLDQLTEELAALKVTMTDDRRLTAMRSKLGASAAPINEPNATTEAAQTDEPVKIMIGRGR